MNLSQIEHSKHDEKVGVVIPTKLSKDLAEEIGIHIGDGSMNIYGNSYLYSLRGHLTDDKEYYQKHILSLYQKLFNLKFNLRAWKDVIGFQRSSKALVIFKSKILNLPLGKKEDIRIPNIIMENPHYLRYLIRGLFDTDGCIYLEKKPPTNFYPRIEISSVSEKLIIQLKEILERDLKFNLSYWTIDRNYRNWKRLHTISVRGFKNAKKWSNTIGTNNPKHMQKFDKIRQFS